MNDEEIPTAEVHEEHAIIVPSNKAIETTLNVSELPRKKSADFVDTYSNNANLVAGFYDLKILFSNIIIGIPNEEPHIEDRAWVSLSWEHAKALRDILSERILDYEKIVGPIRDRDKPSA